jgi:choline dehydrogenase-like flavoprotein
MSRTKGHNVRRYAGHKEILAEKAEKKAVDPEFDELRALRDWAEHVAATAQHAMGFYGSGGDVPAEQVARCRESCKTLLASDWLLRDHVGQRRR